VADPDTASGPDSGSGAGAGAGSGADSGSAAGGARPGGVRPPGKIAVDLDEVPATMLWNLYHRAVEARRPDAVLHDPWAVELVDAIDFPFAQTFGTDVGGRAQWQALRARTFDQQIRRFLLAHPQGTVVALGEGLETQFWRVDNNRVRWLTVDLPQPLALRERLLPAGERQRAAALPAQDLRWAEQVDGAQPVLITAQGLLMYLRPPQVRDLLAGCAARFPGQSMILDAVPHWFSARTLAGTLRTEGGYRSPPMPWAMDADQQHLLHTASPDIAEVADLRLPRGRGVVFGAVLPLLARLPVIGAKRLSVALLRFGGTPAA
jgi:O-methyltransferase involved in polyketide biosynthesis